MLTSFNADIAIIKSIIVSTEVGFEPISWDPSYSFVFLQEQFND